MNISQNFFIIFSSCFLMVDVFAFSSRCHSFESASKPQKNALKIIRNPICYLYINTPGIWGKTISIYLKKKKKKKRPMKNAQVSHLSIIVYKSLIYEWSLWKWFKKPLGVGEHIVPEDGLRLPSYTWSVSHPVRNIIFNIENIIIRPYLLFCFFVASFGFVIKVFSSSRTFFDLHTYTYINDHGEGCFFPTLS